MVIGEAYLAPDAANMSAHSLGSRERSRSDVSRQSTIHNYRKIQHETDLRNRRKSNPMDKIYS